METKLNPISVKVTRQEKRGRKIIIVIESDLYSNENFQISPFHDDNGKNQLEQLELILSVREQAGNVIAKVDFGCNYSKGHTQLHTLKRNFLTPKECDFHWALTTTEEYLNGSFVENLLKKWDGDIQFQDELKQVIEQRKIEIKEKRIAEAKLNYVNALYAYEKEIGLKPKP